MADKNRPLHILKYLWDHTDEEHPAIITDILAHLEGCGIHTNRKTVASDLADLQDSGFDVVCNKSRQNQYFIGSRSLELAELKMIVDAIQAAKFISESKSLTLIEKVSSLASPHQAEQLKRRLYVEGNQAQSSSSVRKGRFIFSINILSSSSRLVNSNVSRRCLVDGVMIPCSIAAIRLSIERCVSERFFSRYGMTVFSCC